MNWEPGDIAAAFAPDLIGRLISALTFDPRGPAGLRWPPCHVAIAFEFRGEVLLAESTFGEREPCVLTGEVRDGVQAQYPNVFCDRYARERGRVDRYRLVDIDRLTADEAAFVSSFITRAVYDRVHYDTPGALFSATRVLPLIGMLPGANLSTLFCSEMVSAILQRIGRMNRDNPTKYNPGRLLRELVRDGVYYRTESITCATDPSN